MTGEEKPSKYNIYFYQTSSGREIILSFIDSLDIEIKAKVRNGIRLLGQHGLMIINTPWIKKVNKNPPIYELRIRSKIEIRLLFFPSGNNNFIIVHGFVKKTNKLPKQELLLAIKRCKEFI